MATSLRDQPSLANLIAEYGSSSSTAWLEFERYRLWRPTTPIPSSTFIPVQGYMEKDQYIFAWGDPIVSSPAALPAVARQFIDFCLRQDKRPVWCCVNREMADVLGEEIGWSTVCCVQEDEVDPAHILAMTSPLAKGKEGQHAVKDLKKNLAKAEKAHVKINEIQPKDWTAESRRQVEQGVEKWRAGKHGLQIASTSMQPWIDFDHRRYWTAMVDSEIVGILILTPIQDGTWQIKNCVSFPSAPKGTSEALIYNMLQVLDLDRAKEVDRSSSIIQPVSPTLSSTSSQTDSDTDVRRVSILSTSTSSSDKELRAVLDRNVSPHESPLPTSSSFSLTKGSVTFGLSASPSLEAIHNLNGWKINALIKTYAKVVAATGIIRRGEFRHKFDSRPVPMYVAYPPEGFGIEGVNKLLKVLKK